MFLHIIHFIVSHIVRHVVDKFSNRQERHDHDENEQPTENDAANGEGCVDGNSTASPFGTLL